MTTRLQDGLLTTTSLPNTSTRTDQYTTNHESYNWTYTDTTINPLYRRSERFDSLGRIMSEQMGYPAFPSLAQMNREVQYDNVGHVSQVDWSGQMCVGWPASTPDSVNNDQGFRDICSPTPLFSESYTYDAVGNRSGGGAAYDAGNRLTSDDWAVKLEPARERRRALWRERSPGQQLLLAGVH